MHRLFNRSRTNKTDKSFEYMTQLLKDMQVPLDFAKIIHIAGTNGKGSTSKMIAQICQNAGFRVGLFTSPHLIDVTERIQISGVPIDPEEFEELCDRLESVISHRYVKDEITFFEFLTLAAVWYFHQKEVDIVVLETGVGGLLDPTNVFSSTISVITSLSYDHQALLGNTIEEIAMQKFGIIKPCVKTAFMTEQNHMVQQLFFDACKNAQCGYEIVSPWYGKLSLLGEYQPYNAGLARAVGLQLGISEDIITKSLQETYWPGRMQYLFPDLLLEGAHNIGGIEYLEKYLQSLNKNVILVASTSRDRSIEPLLRLPCKAFILTQSSVPFTTPISTFAVNDERVHSMASVPSALELAYSLKKENDLVVVTGSLYLIGDVLKMHVQHALPWQTAKSTQKPH